MFETIESMLFVPEELFLEMGFDNIDVGFTIDFKPDKLDGSL